MATEAATNSIPTIDHKPHAAFFRQSGWLMIATIAAGAMTFGIHFLNKGISDDDYGIFVVLMMATACVPTIPLQMVFAQQSAQALATNRERQLAGMIRLGWLWTVIIWVIASAVILIFQDSIIARWKLHDASGLWVSLPVVLASLWMPLFGGVMQGRQDFFWMGWSQILSGASRLIVAGVIVLGFAGGATGMMVGTLAGIGVAAGIGIWRTRDLWSGKAERFDVKASLGQILPLMLGFGACQFMFTADTMFAKAYFPGDAIKPYGAAGTLSRALLWLVLPLAAVMFPKIVHANAKSEKSNLFGIVVLGTGVLAVGGAFGLWLVGPWVVKFVYKSSDVSATIALIPWYSGAMIPLALANVLVNDLLARGRYRVVLPMATLAVVYGFTLPFMLNRFPGRLEVILQVLGAFNLLLFALCAWFTWGSKISNGRNRSSV